MTINSNYSTIVRLIEGWDAYKIYIALKAHFNSDYNFVEYAGKTKASKESYNKRVDKSFFYRKHDSQKRPRQILQHKLGSPSTEDILIFEEKEDYFH